MTITREAALADTLRHFRATHGLSQVQLSKLLGYSHSFVNKLELACPRNWSLPSSDLLIWRLCSRGVLPSTPDTYPDLCQQWGVKPLSNTNPPRLPQP